MLDYHVHLWPHGTRADPLELRIERLAAYCARAGAAGVEEIALTEHLFRFRAGRAAVEGFWDDAPGDAPLRAGMVAYFDEHATADLDEYVGAAQAARAAGLPVVIGLEVDYYPGRMDAVSALLSGYPFDVLLGSVHWLGNWQFDDLDSPVMSAEWDRRGVEAVWSAYVDALGELAASGAVDVLAHPDLVKVAGWRPDEGLRHEFEQRIAEAARSCGLAAELSSAGWRKPAAEAYPSTSLLGAFAARGVPLTTASDSHGSSRVAERSEELAALAAAAGYAKLRAFAGRRGYDVPLTGGAR